MWLFHIQLPALSIFLVIFDHIVLTPTFLFLTPVSVLTFPFVINKESSPWAPSPSYLQSDSNSLSSMNFPL